MPRKYKSIEHLARLDPKFHDKGVSKFINALMKEGKKSVAQRIFYGALSQIEKKVPGVEPVEVFKAAIENVKPAVECRSRRVGGATYQVPVEVAAKRQMALAVKWILTAVSKKKGKPTYIKLADELAAAYKKEGDAMTARENIHKMAEANKAFAHFAWGRTQR